jgi:glycosyltransferase involved in cell wall biosynthesis
MRELVQREMVSGSPPLGRHSSVLVVITHYRCESWLAQCLESIFAQTHIPEGIVVVDDGSERPPLEILNAFPGATLLAAKENVGLFRLRQQVVANTAYDAFMFQDADDWSTPDRLSVLLTEAERTGAEMVGCQVCDHFCGVPEELPVEYPADVNASLFANPFFQPILMTTSVVTRNLIQRLGGLAGGLRFGGDSEFIRRAVFAAKIVNVSQRCYHRRIRVNSLTRHPDTGLTSPARQALRQCLIERTQANIANQKSSESPDLRPLATADTVVLDHLAGPPLLGHDDEARLLPLPIMQRARFRTSQVAARRCA